MSTQKLFFDLLRYEILNEELLDAEKRDFSDAELEKIYRFSKSHDLSHIIAAALDKLGKLADNGLSDKYRKQQFVAMYRCETMSYEKQEICRVLEDAKIPFILLKGAFLRDFYPEAYMRTSTDIDVFVSNEDTDSVAEVLKRELNYTEKRDHVNQRSFFSENGFHVELHFYGSDEYDNEMFVLDKIWDNVYLHDGSEYRYEMSLEYFYLLHISHMVKHFLHGGCGIKPFIDLCVIREKLSLDDAARTALLEEHGLKIFADNAERLVDVWFYGGAHTDITAHMEDYIMRGGVFGNKKNRSSVKHARKRGKVAYILSRIFLPHYELKSFYPIISEHKWLTPFCQVFRWFSLLFRHDLKKHVELYKANNDVTKEEKDDTGLLLRQLGL